MIAAVLGFSGSGDGHHQKEGEELTRTQQPAGLYPTFVFGAFTWLFFLLPPPSLLAVGHASLSTSTDASTSLALLRRTSWRDILRYPWSGCWLQPAQTTLVDNG